MAAPQFQSVRDGPACRSWGREQAGPAGGEVLSPAALYPGPGADVTDRQLIASLPRVTHVRREP
jgi:hypothetical protein